MARSRENRGGGQRVQRVLAGGALAAGIALLGLITTRGAAQHGPLSYSVLYTFNGGTDGANPWAGLVSDPDGNLYGTTQYGGDATSCYGGCGLVFKVDPAGSETVQHAFTGGTDGAKPYAGLIRDTAGNLYGTTEFGGDTSLCGLVGCGVIFKLDPSGNETVLHTFTGGPDGAEPVAGLVRDPAGNFYGTATAGGECSGAGCGVVFKLDSTAQHYSVLYRFTGQADGGAPVGDLLPDDEGNLYGTTFYGGKRVPSCAFGFDGCGVVFKLDPAGNETVLLNFAGQNGANPNGGLIRDTAGNLYGTTLFGGITSGSCPNGFGCGVVFRLDPSGKETVLYTFSGGADGANPYAALVRDEGGSLYGTTFFGGITGSSCANGSSGCGVVFKLDPSGTETVLYSFTGGADGAGPVAGLLSHNGSFYGTAYIGADTGCAPPYGGCGVVFKLH